MAEIHEKQPSIIRNVNQASFQPLKNNFKQSGRFQFENFRPEHGIQRKINGIIRNSSRIILDQKFKKNNEKPIQFKVLKKKAGEWFSSYDPFKMLSTKKDAAAYDRILRNQGREELRSRVPTLYTYTHTKPQNKLSFALQGPHTVAHRVTLQALIDASTIPEVYDIFDGQVLSPDDAEEVVFHDEVPLSGSFNATINERLERYIDDYKDIYDDLIAEFAGANPDLIKLKDMTNRLMNMDPYAVYSWKTTAKASQKSLSGKGESVENPTWDDMYDSPPASSFKSSDNKEAFIDSRKELFKAHF